MKIKKEELRAGKKYYYFCLEVKRDEPLLIQPYLKIGEFTTREMGRIESQCILWRHDDYQPVDHYTSQFFISDITRNRSWKGRGSIITSKTTRFSERCHSSIFTTERLENDLRIFTDILRDTYHKSYQVFDSKQEAIRSAINYLDKSIDTIQEIINRLTSEYYKINHSPLISLDEYTKIKEKWENRTKEKVTSGDKVWGYFIEFNFTPWNNDVYYYLDIPPVSLTFDKWDSTVSTRFSVKESNRCYKFLNNSFGNELNFVGDKEDCTKLYNWEKNRVVRGAIVRLENRLLDFENSKKTLLKQLEKNIVL